MNDEAADQPLEVLSVVARVRESAARFQGWHHSRLSARGHAPGGRSLPAIKRRTPPSGRHAKKAASPRRLAKHLRASTARPTG